MSLAPLLCLGDLLSVERLLLDHISTERGEQTIWIKLLNREVESMSALCICALRRFCALSSEYLPEPIERGLKDSSLSDAARPALDQWGRG